MQLKYSKEEISTVAKKVIARFNSNIVCFNGPMGVGKTTLIKSIIKELGAVDAGNSPSFGLVNEYHNAEGELIAYHFDFYRIETEEEALDMGIEEYFNSGVPVFIEWPRKIENLLPDNSIRLHLQLIDEKTRLIEY